MPVIKFLGRVLPRAVNLTHHVSHKLNWYVTPACEAKFDMTIASGKIYIEVECPVDIDNEILTGLYIRALDFSKMVVDMICFSSGMGLSVVLNQYVSPIGGMSEMMPEDRSVAALCTAFSLDDADGFDAVWRIVMSDQGIFMALNDLIVAITSPHAAPVNCYRAIEGIRHLLAPGLDPKKQWPLMNDALQLEQSYIDIVRVNATQQRHGNRIPVEGSIVREIVRRSWTIMNRFLEYKKRGGGALPQSEFPTLT